ncbi:hypothetical protein GUITHDRAFT_117922 [Guillardia theta CCMP2712]|uniref:Uncharacterized protein n=3 Tax=Guillardia theta TaxID=55529 RepID=L1IJ97_GUITC|nr:hypothetical protein GUITHDRAFT_117922 [Guillardia theta CCMP2712]EKX35890.1 hypothetical protein GUITHDRAFT_117922 [Guillardia theta CCMP2712]|eukprot:XP_005822870.1 hypothetical protein GUITHDRAFT_117922 [Guillardia theta CCMP2712]
MARNRTPESYMTAKVLSDLANRRKLDYEEKLRADELERQKMERRNIAAAFKLREEDFHKEWAMKKLELESKVEQKWKAFEEKKEGRILAFEAAVSRKFYPSIKFSPLVRDYSFRESTQAKYGHYDMALESSRALSRQKKSEEKRQNVSLEANISKQRERLNESLEKEQKEVEDSCTRMKLAFKHKMEIAADRLKQSNRNLLKDVEHAMALEFIQPRELKQSLMESKNQPKSYKSRPQTSSTFWGSRMLERVGRG